MDYNLLKIFIKVAELGSFTKAAKILNQPKSRVSRAITKLEAELEVELIRRTTRKTSLTDNGKEFFHSISPLLEALNSELAKVSSKQEEMSGVIRITASQDIGQTLVAQAISIFNAKYPLVQFQTFITNDFLDLTKENIDIAFRAGKLKDSSLIQKKILSVNFVIVCSPIYIEKYGSISSTNDLLNHKFLSFRKMEQIFFDQSLHIRPLMVSDSIPMLLNMTLNHEGISALPDYFCKEHLERKELIKLIPSWKSKTENIHILYPPSKNISRKVRAFIELVISLFDDK
ncbi:MAG: LysR family transcriptional regulator [Oligoflexales bacterium]